MVKTLKATVKLIITVMLFVAFVACNEDLDNNTPTSPKQYECLLIFNIGENSRGSEINSFKEGDKLYFYFKDPAQIYGSATYTSNKWILKLENAISNEMSGLCDVVYPSNSGVSVDEYHNLVLSPQDGLFGSSEGQWEYLNGVMTVYAHLKPLQNKIQFVSDHQTEIMIKGLNIRDYFNIGRYEFCTSNERFESPCFPQTIKINNKNSDGTYSSEEYYSVGLGSKVDLSILEWSPHDHSVVEGPNRPCTLGDYLYIYDTQITSKCYRKKYLKPNSIGSNIIINVPTPTLHNGWEMIDNQIKIIDNEPRGVYIETGITDACGFSVNFSVRKNFSYEQGFSLSVKYGFNTIFKMVNRHDSWDNYSAIVSTTDAYSWFEIVFNGRSGHSPYEYFKDISYSHFPYYGELIEECE